MSSSLRFVRLTEVSTADLVGLLNHPDVRRHMPLAGNEMLEAEVAAWVAGKERLWEEHGYGPYAFVLDGKLVGWAGFSPRKGRWIWVSCSIRDIGGAARRFSGGWPTRRLGRWARSRSSLIRLPRAGRACAASRLGLEPMASPVHGVPFRRYRLRRESPAPIS